MEKRTSCSWTWLVGLIVPIVLGYLAGVAWLRQRDAVVDTRPVEIWPVEIREVATIEAGSLAGSRFFLLGRVIDSETRAEIPGQVAVESSLWGPWRVGAPFEIAVPAMSVVTLTVTAPGYQTCQVVMKAHYRQDVTLTMDIPLQWLGGRRD